MNVCTIPCLFTVYVGNIVDICDYGLRTSLAEEIKGQMSIVTVFTRRFGEVLNP